MTEDLLSSRAAELFSQHQKSIFTRTDRLFGWLFVLQYIAGIVAALVISPRTWVGFESTLHLHVYAAVFLGALIISFPLLLIKFLPGKPLTRHIVAVAQILISALWIHLSGGRIETHFHVFGSLAFLSFYRDWRVLLTASALVAADHYLRGVFWPVSVYGVLAPDSWRWIEHTAWVVFEDVFLVLASTQSVTEMRAIAERQAEAELKQAKLEKGEQEFRTIFELAGSGNFEVGASGQFLRVNPKFCQFTGYSRDNLLKLRLFDIIPDDERSARETAFHQAANQAQTEWSLDGAYQRKDGSLFWGLTSTSTTCDLADGGFRVISTMQDISLIKAAELEMAEAKAKAEEASETKSAFLANMSHEIRTPLGAMLGFAELMLENESASTDQKSHLKTIIRNGEQLNRVINDILDISKVEANKIEIEKTRFNLNETISDVISLLSLKAIEKGILLNVRKLGPLPATVVTDAIRFKQILINVIGNAIKFSDQGTVDVIFTFQEQGATTACLEVKVADTGRGISLSEQSKLFLPFSQADSATSRKFGGTGLGLYLSRRLIEALGGELQLERSSPGVGSVFVIHIDVGPVETKEMMGGDANVTDNLILPGSVKPAFMNDLHGVKVLVVDDSLDNLHITSWFLEAAGANVMVLSSAEQALTIIPDGNFDVVFMDIQMPGMDGYEAIKRLRAMNYRKMVIALTAHAMKSERERCIRSGFDGFVTKPIDRRTLIQVVSSYATNAIH